MASKRAALLSTELPHSRDHDLDSAIRYQGLPDHLQGSLAMTGLHTLYDYVRCTLVPLYCLRHQPHMAQSAELVRVTKQGEWVVWWMLCIYCRAPERYTLIGSLV
jgi:hypothetical protein